VGLPSIPTVFLTKHLIFLTLTPGDRLTIAHIVGVTGRIITVIRTIHTMLTAARANVLKPNLDSTAIANHRYLFFLLLISVFYGSILECQLKKISEKNILFWHGICSGTRFARSAILAVFAADLPFWQFLCHSGWLTVIIVSR
jgi:hypothetical protein